MPVPDPNDPTGLAPRLLPLNPFRQNPDGKVVGAVVQDRLGSQPPVEVYARVVLNTTGCFADKVG